MADEIPLYAPSPLERDAMALDELKAPFGSAFGAAVDETLARGYQSIDSAIQFDRLQYGVRPSSPLAKSIEPSSPVLSADEAKAMLDAAPIVNKKFEAPAGGFRRDALQFLIEDRRREEARQSVLARAGTDLATQVGLFGAGLVGSVIDPLNIAAAFIPVVGEARLAAGLASAGSTLGRAGVRAAAGAVDGLVGAAAVEPFLFAANTEVQRDYTFADSLGNLAFGAIGGAVLHAGAGFVRDRVAGIPEVAKIPEPSPVARAIADMPAEEQQRILAGAIAQAVEGRAIDIEALSGLRAGGAVKTAPEGRVLDDLSFLNTPEAEAEFAFRTGAAEPIRIPTLPDAEALGIPGAEIIGERPVVQRPVSAEQIAQMDKRIADLEAERQTVVAEAPAAQERRNQISAELRRTDLEPIERQRLERERASIPEYRPQKDVLADLASARAERVRVFERPSPADYQQQIRLAAEKNAKPSAMFSPEDKAASDEVAARAPETAAQIEAAKVQDDQGLEAVRAEANDWIRLVKEDAKRADSGVLKADGTPSTELQEAFAREMAEADERVKLVETNTRALRELAACAVRKGA